VGRSGIFPVVRSAEAGQSGTVTALKRTILKLIEAQGPLTVAQYMAMALGDPEHGYYIRRDPLGRDFITAPEVSQMFGELIGLFFVQAWEDRRRPETFRLVELGPGRGTLMADMMRAAAKSRPQFVDAARIVLVETSPALRAIQERTLASLRVHWAAQLEDIPPGGPLFLIANEFFDALPIRQFVKAERGWHEQMVVSRDDDLSFALTPDTVPESVIPDAARHAPTGSFFEINAAATAIVHETARRIADAGGLALIIDYGHAETASGNTLQAVKANAYCDPLAEPGEADLTAHVDFAALAAAAESAGARVLGPVAQGTFLEALGLRARADRLKRDNAEKAAEIDAAVARLTAPQQMGTLFKALAVYEANGPATDGFT
jgi:NADH dehydrogenase [ubiquinone] 1 alpha subcomplex assembly factor 7